MHDHFQAGGGRGGSPEIIDLFQDCCRPFSFSIMVRISLKEDGHGKKEYGNGRGNQYDFHVISSGTVTVSFYHDEIRP